MIQAFRKIPYPRTLAAVTAAFVLYLLFGFLAVPRLVERGIRGYAAETLRRAAAVGEVRFNPLLFKLELRDFALTEQDGAPIAGFQRLLVDFELSSIARRAWTFSEVAVDGLDLRVDIAPDGKLNLAALAESLPKGDARGARKDGAPPRLLLQHVVLRGGVIAFSDRSGPMPASATVQPLDLELRDISTLPDRRGPYTISARLREGGTLAWRGEVSLQPVFSQGEIQGKGFKPATAWRFLHERPKLAEPAGEIAFSARYRFEYARGAPRLAVEDIRVLATGIALSEPGAKEPLLALDTIEATGGRFDLERRQIAIGNVAVTGGAVRIAREADGKIRIVEALGGAGGGKGGEPSAAGAAPEPANLWRFALDALQVEGVRIALADRSLKPAVAYDLEDVRARVSNITNDGRTPVEVEAALRVAQGGGVRASGEVGADGSRASARVKVERVALKPLQPLLARMSTLKLESGELSADAKVEYRAVKGRPELRVAGGAGIGNLLVNEAATGDRLLAWKALTADGVAFSLQPDRLRVREVRVVQPGAKIVIFKDRSLNLARAFEPQPAQGAAAPPPEAPKPPVEGAPATAAAPFDVGVERVRVENGVVDFADLSLVLPFATTIEEFQGTATGISSDPASGTALDFEGRVGEYGLARVDGSLRPFQPKSFTDIGVVFRNVEMTPLSPYSATFAGRKIASGRLALDLRYRIENSRLAGDNKVVMEKFTLGERVEAPEALDLPYDLAIALLTDSEGRIDVAVPVSGSVDAPEFSYRQLISQAIATVLRNIVTAPFRALAGLLGGGSGRDVESVAFDAGRAALRPPEREKLKGVAEALGKRPQLALVVEGQFGEADRAALRQRDVALAISGKLGRPPAAGAAPERVNPLDARTQRALEALFVERGSEEALSRFVADAEKTRGKPVQRVNPVLALAGRGSADAAFYEAMLKHLNETARIPGEALAQLADARARAVAGYLVETLSVPAARVAAKAAAEPGEERVKLSFDVARQAAAGER